MSAADLLKFAAGSFRGHRLRTALSLVGVGIGVAAVVLLTSLGEGARLYVSGEFLTLGSNLLIVVPGKTETTGAFPVFGGVPRDLTLDDALALERGIPAVRKMAPIIIGTARARVEGKSREITVAGTTAEFLGVRNLTLRSGQYLPDGDVGRGQRVCVIGAKVESELFEGRNPLGETMRVGGTRYRVIGVMAPRGESIGFDMDEMIHVPVSQSMKMFNRSGLFRIFLEVRFPRQMEHAERRIIEILKERHGGVEDVTVLTQDAVLTAFNRILRILTAALGGIAAVSLSVAGIGIMNVMLVAVTERTSEVGLLKALGVTRGQILGVFLVEAAMMSTLGGLLGLGVGFAGLAVARDVLPDFPLQPPVWAVYGGLAVAIGVGVVFGAIPARRASGLDPVLALRKRRR